MLNMALLLRVVNEGEHVVVNQVTEEVNPSIEIGSNTYETSQEPDFSVNEGKPQMHLNPTLCFIKLFPLLLLSIALRN